MTEALIAAGVALIGGSMYLVLGVVVGTYLFQRWPYKEAGEELKGSFWLVLTWLWPAALIVILPLKLRRVLSNESPAARAARAARGGPR